MSKRKTIFTERGETAERVVSVMRKNYKITDIKFSGEYCTISFLKTKKGEEKPGKVFICPDCNKVTTEKPERCSNCGADVSKLKGKNIDNFLEENVYSGD